MSTHVTISPNEAEESPLAPFPFRRGVTHPRSPRSQARELRRRHLPDVNLGLEGAMHGTLVGHFHQFLLLLRSERT